jgi:predicted nuclease of predicted toxin-antitoxin system
LTDEEQIETATKNKAIIFTHTTDFLRIEVNQNHFGIVYVHNLGWRKVVLISNVDLRFIGFKLLAKTIYLI